MSHRPTGQAPSRLVAVLGPTNTGKTHLAVERMLGHASGMIGLPLRLLAREIYDRVAAARGAASVALITGEEKIVPARAHYFVCTVEAMPLNRRVEFLAVDEIQLAGDPGRGHLFTHRLLHARGTFETMFLGAATMAPLIRRLLPAAEIVTRERYSSLTYLGPRKLTRLPRRSAVVAFSAEEVYAIAELIRRQRGGAAVVMGSLSPRTRNAQVALFQSGEVDFLVATDAIGMGLNMDVDHVAFGGLSKFDGKRQRRLHPQEVGQIAGRAGRFRADGTFGVTGACEAMEPELVAAVEAHAFGDVPAAVWRNAALDFQSLGGLRRSLAAPPPREGLKASDEALDELALRALAADPEVADRCADRSVLFRLWDACQTPDFRKTTQDEHIRLVRRLFDHLSLGDRRISEDWMAEQHGQLDRLHGEIDALSTRLAGVRTLAYVANRQGWLADPVHWREVTRALEARLSDALHEKLMARFVDRRTSALMRGLGRSGDLLAGVAADGVVTVEGCFVGRLRGLRFEAAQGSGALEAKALRAAVQRAVGPEMARRLGQLAAEGDEAFALEPTGEILWRGEAAGVLAGDQPFSPVVRLHGELGPGPARERAARRLEAFVAALASRRLWALKGLADAVASGDLKGLARGLAYRLIEGGGVLARQAVERDLAHLSRAERRTLRALGVRFGAFSLFLPSQGEAPARSVALAFARRAAPDWRPRAAEGPGGPNPDPVDRPSAELIRLPEPPPPARALGLRGLLAAGPLAAPAERLERLGELLRPVRDPAEEEDGKARPGGLGLTEGARAELGWSEVDLEQILRALGFTPIRKPAPGAPRLWRRRRTEDARREPSPGRPLSPFAALAALRTAQGPAAATRAPERRGRRRRRRLGAAATGATAARDERDR
jgi:ATP-dependent RNA helicase SUPV3L1/SUV3